MKVYHELHQTAWSRRTEGMPLVFYDAEGRVTREAETTKKECWFEVPDQTAYAVWFYRSNSGRTVAYVFDVRGGRLERVRDEAALPPWLREVKRSHEVPAL